MLYFVNMYVQGRKKYQLTYGMDMGFQGQIFGFQNTNKSNAKGRERPFWVVTHRLGNTAREDTVICSSWGVKGTIRWNSSIHFSLSVSLLVLLKRLVLDAALTAASFLLSVCIMPLFLVFLASQLRIFFPHSLRKQRLRLTVAFQLWCYA